MTSSGATGTMRRVEPLPLSGAEQKALREVWGQTLVELGGGVPRSGRARWRSRQLHPRRHLRRGGAGSLLRDGYRRAEHGRRSGRHGDARLRALALDLRRLHGQPRHRPGAHRRGATAPERQDVRGLHRHPDRKDRQDPPECGGHRHLPRHARRGDSRSGRRRRAALRHAGHDGDARSHVPARHPRPVAGDLPR